jgi:hypothetical protein
MYIHFTQFITSHLEMAAISPGVRRPFVRLTVHVTLVPRLRVGGALLPLPLRALIAYTEINLISKLIHPPTALTIESKGLNTNVNRSAAV